jgi:hypothetical protein
LPPGDLHCTSIKSSSTVTLPMISVQSFIFIWLSPVAINARYWHDSPLECTVYMLVLIYPDLGS